MSRCLFFVFFFLLFFFLPLSEIVSARFRNTGDLLLTRGSLPRNNGKGGEFLVYIPFNNADSL